MESLIGRIRKLKVKEEIKEDKGYKTLMSVIDRKVFGVEDATITKGEFEELRGWIVREFKESPIEKRTLGGKVIKEKPLVIAEVIGEEPIFVEIEDFDVRYRVNIYLDRRDIDIRVLGSIKEDELKYGYKKEVSYQL